MMKDLHLLVAEVALVLARLTKAWSDSLLVTRHPPRRFFSVNLSWTVDALVVATASDVMTLATRRAPHDAPAPAFAALALASLLLTSLVATQRSPRQQVLVTTVGTIVPVILVLRLFQPGG